MEYDLSSPEQVTALAKIISQHVSVEELKLKNGNWQSCHDHLKKFYDGVKTVIIPFPSGPAVVHLGSVEVADAVREIRRKTFALHRGKDPDAPVGGGEQPPRPFT